MTAAPPATRIDVATSAALRRVTVVQAQVMFTCNNACWFCLDRSEVDGEFHGGPAIVPFARVESLLRQERARANAVVFTHGEPTLHPQLIDMLRLARDLGYEQRGVVTNGRKIADVDLARGLCEAGANRWVVSIHGANAQVHDASVGRPAFGQASQGLLNLASLKDEFGLQLASSTVVSRLNLAAVAETVSYLAAAGVAQIVLNIVRPTGHAAKHFAMVVPRYREVVEQLAPLLASRPDLARRVVVEDIAPCAAEPLAPWLGVLESWLVPAGDESANAPRSLDLQRAGPTATVQLGEVEQGVGGDLRKRAECRTCIHDRHCWGVWGRYLDTYGWQEFNPTLKPSAGHSEFAKRVSQVASTECLQAMLPLGWTLATWTLDERRDRLLFELAEVDSAQSLTLCLQLDVPSEPALLRRGGLRVSHQGRRGLAPAEQTLIAQLFQAIADSSLHLAGER